MVYSYRNNFSRIQKKSQRSGFTLIEVLVVSPMIILMLGAVIAMIVNLSSSAMRSGAEASLQNDVLMALDRIEQDTKVSTDFSGSTSSQVVLKSLATNKSPYDPDRKLISNSDCSVSEEGLASSSALKYTLSYRVSGSRLERSPVFPSGCAQTSTNIWQSRESENLIDVGENGSITIVTEPGGESAPTTLKVTITATKPVAGEDISFTGVIYAKSLNLL